jgi:hypothetical protein
LRRRHGLPIIDAAQSPAIGRDVCRIDAILIGVQPEEPILEVNFPSDEEHLRHIEGLARRRERRASLGAVEKIDMHQFQRFAPHFLDIGVLALIFFRFLRRVICRGRGNRGGHGLLGRFGLVGEVLGDAELLRGEVLIAEI